MKFDTVNLTYTLADIPGMVRSAEALGFDGFWLSETTCDPFMALTLAAEHSQRLTLGTGIAVAFPRSPTTLAYIGWELARYSHGRAIIGLGTQVRAHIERRFGVTWDKPVTRLRETVLAMRALWDCWQNGTPLKFEGELVRLDLMTPFFSPAPHDYPRVPVYIAAVNENMLQLVGEACDGVFLHSLHSVKYIREYAIPHIEAGLARSGRSLADVAITTGVFVVPTDDPHEAAQAEAYVKQQISFYMSTPAYRVVAELHGWEETAHQLGRLARSGGWAQMPDLITDDILDTIAISGTWAQLPGKIREKYGDSLDRVSYYLPFTPAPDHEGWRATVNGFRALV